MLSNWTITERINKFEKNQNGKSECGIIFTSDSKEIESLQISYSFDNAWNISISLKTRPDCSQATKSALQSCGVYSSDAITYSMSDDVYESGFETCGRLAALNLAPHKNALIESFKEMFLSQQKQQHEQWVNDSIYSEYMKNPWTKKEKELLLFIENCAKSFDGGNQNYKIEPEMLVLLKEAENSLQNDPVNAKACIEKAGLLIVNSKNTFLLNAAKQASKNLIEMCLTDNQTHNHSGTPRNTEKINDAATSSAFNAIEEKNKSTSYKAAEGNQKTGKTSKLGYFSSLRLVEIPSLFQNLSGLSKPKPRS